MDITNIRFELAGYSITGQMVAAAAGVLVLLVATVVVRRGSRRRKDAAAAQAESVAHHESLVRSYRENVDAWHRRRDDFRGLLETARTSGSRNAAQ